LITCELKALLGASHSGGSHSEKWISSVGAGLGIGCFGLLTALLQTSGFLSDVYSANWLAPCFGASCVLLFAIPHSPFSQPWPLTGGYLVSAVAGLLSIHLFEFKIAQAAVALSLSVLLMYYLRCLHPPGGAAALLPILSSPTDWTFIMYPILTGAVCLLVIAVLYNVLMSWRRYPASLSVLKNQNKQNVQLNQSSIALNHEDVNWALQQMDSFIDISPEDLSQLFELAAIHQSQSRPTVSNIASHPYYSNGRTGYAWQVFEVLDVVINVLGQRTVTYRVIAGTNTGFSEELVLPQFLALAVIPVEQMNGNWVRLTRCQPTA